MKRLTFLFLFLAACLSLYALGGKEEVSAQTPTDYTIEENVSALEIKWNYGNIHVTDTDGKLTISTASQSFEYTVQEGRLVITESAKATCDLTLSIPKGTVLTSFRLSSGVGSVQLDSLRTDSLVFKLNVGDVSCNFETMPKTVDFTSGTGDVNITFPGTETIGITAPYGLGGRDFSERITDVKDSDIRIEVSVGNTSIR